MRGVVCLNEADHRKKGDRNQKLIADLEGAKLDYKDWIIVAAFYAAIHYVMAYLHGHVPGYNDINSAPTILGRRGTDQLKGHRHRLAMVEMHLPRLLRDYNYLYMMAEEARYHQLDMSSVKPNELSTLKDIIVRKFQTL